MYRLYHSQVEHKLVIETVKTNIEYGNRVVFFNYCYYVCNDRKELKKFANEMRDRWIVEAEEDLKALKEMKIVTKY